MSNDWDPGQYHRFAAERRAPFYDLLSLCSYVKGGTICDLGCGSGELTAILHQTLGAKATLGIDNSVAMLGATPLATSGLTFRDGALEMRPREAPFDLLFSNAALHWVPDHDTLIPELCTWVQPGGQIAFQIPANSDHASHRLAVAVAESDAFRGDFDGPPPPDASARTLSPRRYAELLDEAGCVHQIVTLRVYTHELESTRAVVEWVKGSTLTRFKAVLSPARYVDFIAAYTDALLSEIGDRAPYRYTFQRVLAWGQLGETPAST